MKYEMMFPDEVRKAIDENIPVVLALGVLEYHSEHMSLGVDTLLVIKAIEILEKEFPMVVMPPFYYGASSFAVEPPERKGTVHVNSGVLLPFAGQFFYNLLRIGFRNINVFIHHQCENFSSGGMPTDLAFKLAARQELFAYMEKEKGEGWWGDNSFAEDFSLGLYNAENNPFNWIRINPFMSSEARSKFPVDHAGKQETSLMMAFCSEGVDMTRFSDEKWYSKEAKNASLEYGNLAKGIILDDMRKAILQ